MKITDVLEYDRSPHPFRQHLIKEPIALTEGFVVIPSKRGLDIKVDRATIEKYRIQLKQKRSRAHRSFPLARGISGVQS